MPQLPVLLWVKVMVVVDFFAVSLVVPILSSYFQEAGVDTKLYGLISSLYSIAQLLGGVMMGFLSDSLSKKEILLASFIGSGISYFIVGFCKSIPLLFFSRLLVGSVKQTISTCSLIITEVTMRSSKEQELSSVSSSERSGEDRTEASQRRTKELAQIGALSSACFIVGPSLGGLLFKEDPRLPALIASGLFVVNACICRYLAPKDEVIYAKRNNSNSDLTSQYEEAKLHQSRSDSAVSRLSKGKLVSASRKNNDTDNGTNHFGTSNVKKTEESDDVDDETLWLNSSSRDLVGVSSVKMRFAEESSGTNRFSSASRRRSRVSNTILKSESDKGPSREEVATVGSDNEQLNNSDGTFGFIRLKLLEIVKQLRSALFLDDSGRGNERQRLYYSSAMRLGLMFIQSSLSARNILHYYEDRFGLETYQLGFVSSATMMISVMCEGMFVGPVLKLLGNDESRAQLICLACLVAASTAESVVPSLPYFLVFALLPATVSGSVLSSATRSLFINSVPQEHLGKVWGLFNMASTSIGVIAPLYGSQLFSLFPCRPIAAADENSDGTAEKSYGYCVADYSDRRSDWKIQDTITNVADLSWSLPRSAARAKGYLTAAHYLLLLFFAATCYFQNSNKTKKALPSSHKSEAKPKKENSS